MAEDFVLSASSLNTYLRCGRQWFYAYVMGVKAPPSLRAIRGTAVHSAVELNMRQKLDSKTDLLMDVVLDGYSDAYDAAVGEGFEARKDETPGSVKDAGIGLVKIYHTDVAPGIDPILVEQPISFTVNGRTWTGQIDLADRKSDVWGSGIRVRDTKTSSSKPKPEQYKVNMTGYSIGAEMLIPNEPVVAITFDYLVATKTPYYTEISSGPVTDGQKAAFGSLVDEVGELIEKGAFPANGLTNPGVCDWCGYRSMCPAYKIKDPNAGGA